MTRVSEVLRHSNFDVASLEARTGVPADRLQAIMNGSDSTLAELRAIAAGLGKRLSDFVSTTPSEERANVLFRNNLSRRHREQKPVVNDLAKHVSLTFELLTPRVATTPWDQFAAIRSHHSADPEGMADAFRELFCNGDHIRPLLDLPKLASDLGLLLFSISSQDIEGASAIVDQVGFVFVARRTFRPRMLFTLAHELAHVVAHHDPHTDAAFIDEPQDVEGRVRARMESVANTFATALLLPRQGVGVTLQSIRQRHDVASTHQIGDIEILLLARLFGVSFLTAALRLESLDLIPRGGAASLSEALTRQYGSAERRANEAGLPPRSEIEFPMVSSHLLARAVNSIREGGVSLGRASFILGLPISTLLEANVGQ